MMANDIMDIESERKREREEICQEGCITICLDEIK